MKTKLITGLRTAAKAMEEGTFFYEWSKQSCCNCGSLFCALTGQSAVSLSKRVPDTLDDSSPTWENIIGQYCPITGMPEHELFRELFGYGLTQKDMINLEYLRDERVIARMNLTQEVRDVKPVKKRWWQLRVELDHQNKDHVIAYMRAWADLLTEEGRQDSVRNTEKPCEKAA